MNFTGGIVLLGASIVMIFFGRARAGEERAIFRRYWIVGQLYALITMMVGLAGVGAIILNWPL
jgi:hypothetical protein